LSVVQTGYIRSNRNLSRIITNCSQIFPEITRKEKAKSR